MIKTDVANFDRIRYNTTRAREKPWRVCRFRAFCNTHGLQTGGGDYGMTPFEIIVVVLTVVGLLFKAFEIGRKR